MLGSVLWNEPLSRHTTLGIGGPAKALFYPATEEDLKLIFNLANERNIPVYFIGSGTNLLVSDGGFNGFIISLSKHFKTITFNGIKVFCQGGVMLGHFVKECIKRNLKGVETLAGIPGTVGGALRMNAGAFGKEISKHLKSVQIMTLSGRKKQYSKDKIKFNYRDSSFPNDELILSSNFELKTGQTDEIQTFRKEVSQKRKSSQPLRFRSAGSVFKNPSQKEPAGYLIDRAGLKGTQYGSAEISSKHANFFLNLGHSSAEDMIYLIHLARKTVLEKFGVTLELEIKTLGFPPKYFDA